MDKNNQGVKKRGIISKIFVVFGVIFVIILLLLGVLIIVKPYGVNVVKVISTSLEDNPTSSYDHPYLSTQQESILESAGIDPKTIPTKITASQQECAISILGKERATEIASGSSPSITEVLKLKSCLNK